jgi:hypothetical protein
MGYLVTEDMLTPTISLDAVKSAIRNIPSLLAIDETALMGLDDLRKRYNRLPSLDQAKEFMTDSRVIGIGK